MEMRYVCRCNKTFANTDGLKAHIFGSNSTTRQQEPCPSMASFSVDMSDKSYALQHQIQSDMGFITLPKKCLPGGIKLKMDYSEEEEDDGNEEE
jgi:hypothetical protein